MSAGQDDAENPGVSQRFEVFIGGLEIGNAYSELNDPVEQRKRLTEDLEDDVETGNRNVDEDFFACLGIRDAAGRRAGHRDRSAGHAFDRRGIDPGRHFIPAS